MSREMIDEVSFVHCCHRPDDGRNHNHHWRVSEKDQRMSEGAASGDVGRPVRGTVASVGRITWRRAPHVRVIRIRPFDLREQ